jgi:hypothetical protein
MDNTIIQQGRFTSDGTSHTLSIRSDVDWMKVLNLTVAATTQTTAVGVEYYWQRGFAQDRGIEYKKSNAANAANLTEYIASGGFTLVDSSINPPGALTAVTSINTATPPEVTVSSTAGLVDGDVVRMINITSGQQLGGVDFTIDVTGGTTFQLEYMTAIAAATTGFYRKINFNPIFYPRHRFISEISVASQAVVTMTVTHGYQIGQEVRFVVPAAYGMVEMDGLQGAIVAIDTTANTITVDIDSSTFTAFTFPLSAAAPFSPALVVPIGENTAVALDEGVDILTDATLNTAFIGMRLAAGANSPAGVDNDVIYWVAGKSFNVDNL